MVINYCLLVALLVCVQAQCDLRGKGTPESSTKVVKNANGTTRTVLVNVVKEHPKADNLVLGIARARYEGHSVAATENYLGGESGVYNWFDLTVGEFAITVATELNVTTKDCKVVAGKSIAFVELQFGFPEVYLNALGALFETLNDLGVEPKMYTSELTTIHKFTFKEDQDGISIGLRKFLEIGNKNSVLRLLEIAMMLSGSELYLTMPDKNIEVYQAGISMPIQFKIVI